MPIPLDDILALDSRNLLGNTWNLREAIFVACILEAATPKLGNVHPDASFDDMSFRDFVDSSRVIAEHLSAVGASIGQRCDSAARAMRAATNTNPHLGTILLLAPLATAHEQLKSLSLSTAARFDLSDFRQATENALRSLSAKDSQDVYSAIRSAKPGGLGKSDQHDVESTPPADLLDAMAAAEERDLIARQFTHGFEDVFETLLPMLYAEMEANTPLSAISRFQIRALAWHPDSLIARKCGLDKAAEIQRSAEHLFIALQNDVTTIPSIAREWQSLDRRMRQGGNALNPGTIADMIAATIFCALILTPPTA